MKYGEQQRIFKQLPGMSEAEFLRLGSMHRNTYIDSPRVLSPTLQLRSEPRVIIAGQLTGTEGYLESSATGWLAGFNAARLFRDEKPIALPPETMLGGLVATITDPLRTPFQPMNANMGILPPTEATPKKKDKAARNLAFSSRSKQTLGQWMQAGRFVIASANSPDVALAKSGGA
jgi:methylenetetrahydrofolate--tRNA-(uracil-5-)-methyltransferase